MKKIFKIKDQRDGGQEFLLIYKKNLLFSALLGNELDELKHNKTIRMILKHMPNIVSLKFWAESNKNIILTEIKQIKYEKEQVHNSIFGRED